jgi:cytochrome d ubiquinol oxidase subunit II
MQSTWIWYTAAGLAALSTVALHGSLWVALKAEGGQRTRARQLASRAWWVAAPLTALTVCISLGTHPALMASYTDQPMGLAFPTFALAGLLGTRLIEGERSELLVFLASCVFVVGALSTGLYSAIR